MEIKATVIVEESIKADIKEVLQYSETQADNTKAQLEAVGDVLIEKGLADETTHPSQYSRIISDNSMLKPILDISKSTNNFFANADNINLDNLIKYNDTENVIDMSYMFSSAKNLEKAPELNTKNVTNMEYMFNRCSALKEIPVYNRKNVNAMNHMFYSCKSLKKACELDLSNVKKIQNIFAYCEALEEASVNNSSNITQMDGAFYSCSELQSIKGLDAINIFAPSGISNITWGCKKLKEFIIYNIKYNFTFGGSSYSNLLPVENLIHICKECIKQSSILTLTMGSTYIAKLADVYVKFIDTTQTTIAVGEKGDVVVCESTDEGAMTITEYMTLKSWTLK